MSSKILDTSKTEDATIKNSICEDLDRLAILYIECYQEILISRDLLNNILDDAYLNLSKARSLVGCKNLSLLQIPAEINASLFVNVDLSVYDDDENLKLNYQKYNLVDNNNEEFDETKTTKLPNWFGVLTPLNLKTSHKSFFKSINIILRLCELQSKLRSIENEYKNLFEKKQTTCV